MGYNSYFEWYIGFFQSKEKKIHMSSVMFCRIIKYIKNIKNVEDCEKSDL